jgi:radical SAM superfamily enzyme YgiQ (UPF0313 family)
MDILIINPGSIRDELKTEHLGIASLDAYLNSKGFKVDSLDMGIEDLSIKDTINQILHINPIILGVSMMDATKDTGLSIIRKLRDKKYKGKIVVGGYFPTFASYELLKDFPEIDFVVRGEGELTLAELAEKIINRKAIDFSKIQGLSYRESEQVIENSARRLIEDLNILPPVSRKYTRGIINQSSHIRIYASRGCWGQCSFCDIISFYRSNPGRKWRRRSVKRLVDEIQQLINKFEEKYFIFNDDQFLSKGQTGYQYASELATELKKRNLKIKFELMCRADTIDKKTMLVLKSIGLQRVFLGIESFNEAQLKRFNKKITVFRNIKSLIILYRLKIDVITAVILADAFTTLSELLEHFYMLYLLRKRYFNSRYCRISISNKIEIYRGSNLYHQYKTNGLLKTDNYLIGYTYHLRFFTNIRIKVLAFEKMIIRLARSI